MIQLENHVGFPCKFNSKPECQTQTVEVLFTCSLKHRYWTAGPTGELGSLFLNAFQSEYDKWGPFYLLF